MYKRVEVLFMLHFQRITIILKQCLYPTRVFGDPRCGKMSKMLCTFIMNCAFVWTQIVLLSGSRSIIVQGRFKSKHKPAATTPSVRHIILAQCAAYLYIMLSESALHWKCVIGRRAFLLLIHDVWKKFTPITPSSPPHRRNIMNSRISRYHNNNITHVV